MFEVCIILLIVAVVLFGFDGIKLAHPAFSWTPLAWAFVVASAVVWLLETTPAFGG